MQAWKDNKTVQFAVGVTLTLLLVRWLLTGDLLFAADVAMNPPAQEGETKSAAIVSVLWPVFFDAMVIVGASAIAWAFRLWDALYGLIQRASGESTATTSAALQYAQPVFVDGLVQGLTRAAATNDADAMTKIKSRSASRTRSRN